MTVRDLGVVITNWGSHGHYRPMHVESARTRTVVSARQAFPTAPTVVKALLTDLRADMGTMTRSFKLPVLPTMSMSEHLLDRRLSSHSVRGGQFTPRGSSGPYERRLFPSGPTSMFLDDSFLPFGSIEDADAEDSPAENLPPDLRKAGRYAYRRGWEAYREAGCPFGPEDEAMLVWFSFSGAQTETPLTVGRN